MMTCTGISIRRFIAKPIKLMLCLGFCLSALSPISAQLRIQDNSYRLGLLDTDESLLHGISGDHNGALTLRTLSLYNGSLSQTANRILIGSGAPGAVDFSLMDFPTTLPGDTSLWIINPDGSGRYISANFGGNAWFDIHTHAPPLSISDHIYTEGSVNIRTSQNGEGLRVSYEDSHQYIIDGDDVFHMLAAPPGSVPVYFFRKSNGQNLFNPQNIIPGHKISGVVHQGWLNDSWNTFFTNKVLYTSELQDGVHQGVWSLSNGYMTNDYILQVYNSPGHIQFNKYGQGNMTDTILSKTYSGHLAGFAEDGTIIEVDSDLSSGSGGGNGLFDATNNGDTIAIDNVHLSGPTLFQGAGHNSSVTFNNFGDFNILAGKSGIEQAGLYLLNDAITAFGVENTSESIHRGIIVHEDGILLGNTNHAHFEDDQLLNGIGISAITGNMSIKSPSIRLNDQPQSNDTEDAILVRNATTGVIEQRDASTLSANPTNGLDTIDGGIGLGGVLTSSTSIQGNSNPLYISELGEFSVNLTNNGPGLLMGSSGISQLSSRETIIQGESTTIGSSVSTVILTPKMILYPSPPHDNTEENILVHNATTGELLIRDASTLTTSPTNGLDTINGGIGLGGGLTKSTAINGNQHSLYFDNIKTFSISSNDGGYIEKSFNGEINLQSAPDKTVAIGASGGLIIYSPNISISPFNPPPETTSTNKILVWNPSNGFIEQRDASTLSSTPSNGLEIKADGSIGLGGSLTDDVGISGGGGASFSLISMDEFEIEATSLLLGAHQEATFNFPSLDINSGNVILSQPLTQTTTEDAILVRNSTSGKVEVRDAATLFELLGPYLAQLPRYNKANDAAADAALPSGSLFKVKEGNGSTSSIYIKE